MAEYVLRPSSSPASDLYMLPRSLWLIELIDSRRRSRSDWENAMLEGTDISDGARPLLSPPPATTLAVSATELTSPPPLTSCEMMDDA